MNKYQMKIELLSDLCVSDGGVYNSALDIDICQDEFGFPYIPAKRMKGCLREKALELNDWGKKIKITELFGDEGKQAPQIKIGNAYLENYKALRKKAEKYQGNPIFHPQNVLNFYSYVRTQTSIDYETGVAAEGSLRTMRVANKGLTFLAEIEMPEYCFSDFEACCKIMTHMGMSQTRGLGEVRVTVKEITQGEDDKTEGNRIPDWVEDATTLRYRITLEDPMICKSVNGGETRTLDYIEGSKILGLIAELCRENNVDFVGLTGSGKLFCSNAYISIDGKRSSEVPAYCYAIKNEKKEYIDKCMETPEAYQEVVEEQHLQLNEMKHCYVLIDENGVLKKKQVLIGNRMHHRRPEDKSIGRAVENEEDSKEKSGLYQMSSMESGQSFEGYICGTKEQMKKIYDLFKERTQYQMGYARNAEYGNIRLDIVGLKTEQEQQPITLQNFTVTLNAPSIVYSEKAMYTTDVNCLIREINAALGLTADSQICAIKKYVHYTSIGGFQVSWGRRKPVISAFDKGTVLEYHLKEPVQIVLTDPLLIGERTSEGYGEIKVSELDYTNGKYRNLIAGKADGEKEMPEILVEDSFEQKLCHRQLRQYIKMQTIRHLQALQGKQKKEELNPSIRATVSNMLLMTKESDSLEAVREKVEDRFGKMSGNKASKYKVAEKILEEVEQKSKSILEQFCAVYHIQNLQEADNVDMLYLSSFLTEVKYRIRKLNTKQEKGGENS